MIYGAERNQQGNELSQQWAQQATDDDDSSSDGSGDSDAEPPAVAAPGEGERFGVMHVPRWGDDYAMPMAGGTTRPITLDPIGIGHYHETELPGEVGNFALAGAPHHLRQAVRGDRDAARGRRDRRRDRGRLVHVPLPDTRVRPARRDRRAARCAAGARRSRERALHHVARPARRSTRSPSASSPTVCSTRSSRAPMASRNR